LNELEKINDAILKLKRSKIEISIMSIAKKSGVNRRMIYRKKELKERCMEAMGVANELKIAKEEIASTGVKKKRYTIAEKYENSQKELEISRIANAKLLENNRQYIIEEQRLKARITMLESRIEDMKNKKVIPFK
jgi:hypothetical protein